MIDVGRFLARRAELEPGREALVLGEARLTYAQLDRECNRVAHALARLGVRRGDRVGLLASNSPRFCQVFFACARLGAVLVTLNWRLAPPEHAWICADADLGVLVFAGEFRDHVERLRALVPAIRYAVVDGSAPDWAAPLDTLVAESPDHEPPPSAGEDDPLLIMYTSGTTGRPRGAVLTHATLYWAAATVEATLDFRRGDRVLIVMPLYHIGAIDYLTICVHRGCTAVLMRSFDAARMLDTIRTERIDTFLAVATMLQALAEQPHFDSAMAGVRWLLCGAAPVPVPLIEAYARRGIAIQQSYGLTETAGPAAALGPERALDKAGSTGKPFFHTELRVVDGSGRDVGVDAVGEVLVRGPHVMREYWRDPAGTAEALRGGWLHTGDLARRDAEGFLYIVDRMKDMIVSGGENVYPAEIESCLHAHPGVAEVAVVGVPDPRWGEAACAVVVPRAGAQVTLAELAACCEGKLARYKIPRSLVLWPEPLPRNPTGKLLKGVLRQRLGAGGQGWTSR